MDIQDFVKNYQRARVSMTDAGIFGCRCDIDDVSPGDCCFCQLIVLDDMADSIESEANLDNQKQEYDETIPFGCLPIITIILSISIFIFWLVLTAVIGGNVA